MDTAKELPTVISFCSGYGGIERGLDLAGVEHRVLAYVEIEAYAIANLVAKMETGQLVPAPIFTDLKTFPAHIFRGCVDIITGGYPCQPFSAAGKRLGTDDPRHLWPFIRQHIQSIRPVRCLFENVEGHISMGLSSVISDLEEDGYSATWGIFSASEVGAKHQRKRVYIMADRDGQWEQQYGRLKREVGGWSGDGSEEPDVADAISTGLEGHPGYGDTGNEPGRHQPQAGGSTGEGSIREPGNNMANARRAGQQVSVQQQGDGRSTEIDRETNWFGDSSTSGQYEQHGWEPEPRLGRVVDGGADRVDRIRLLGNGVVPPTVARAWQVLSARFAK